MTRTLRVLLGLAVCLALSPAAFAAPRVVGGKQPAPAPKAAEKPLSVAPNASAAKHGIGKGDKEFGFFLTFDNTEDTDTNTLTIGAVLGTYLKDTLELRVTPVIIYTDQAGFSFFGFNPYVTLEKQFPNGSPVVPYVGGGIGINLDYGSGSGLSITDLGVFVTPTAGLKFFVGERMSLEYALGYQYGIDYQCVDAGGYSSCDNGTRSSLKNDLRFNIYF